MPHAPTAELAKQQEKSSQRPATHARVWATTVAAAVRIFDASDPLGVVKVLTDTLTLEGADRAEALGAGMEKAMKEGLLVPLAGIPRAADDGLIIPLECEVKGKIMLVACCMSARTKRQARLQPFESAARKGQPYSAISG
jgi:hypothetical protein